MYSNCCCSCAFELEIIKIGQSSHMMYSIKLQNFQESTIIKMSGNFLNAPRIYIYIYIYICVCVCVCVCVYMNVYIYIYILILSNAKSADSWVDSIFRFSFYNIYVIQKRIQCKIVINQSTQQIIPFKRKTFKNYSYFLK